MHDQLHAPRLIKETLQHEPLLGWDRAKCSMDCRKIVGQLLCAGSGQPEVRLEPLDESGFRSVPFFSSVSRIFSRPRTAIARRLPTIHRCVRALHRSKRAFPAAGRGRPQRAPCPESTFRIRHEALPSWKISPAMLSTAKSSLTRADERLAGLQDDAVIGIVRDSASGGQRRQARSASARERVD